MTSLPHFQFNSEALSMLACPYCQQEDVWEIRLKASDRTAVMCFECDTVWDSVEDVNDQKGRSFEAFMAEVGLTLDWNAAEKVRQM
jgi:hypothetical protein